MDQEKNLNEEVTEAVEEAVETVEETIEDTVEEVTNQVEETVEEVEEKVRPVVYDDFNEAPEAPEKEEKAKKGLGFGALAISTVISSVISVAVTLAVLFFMNAIPAWFTAAQIDGVWSLDMSEYQMGNIYVILDGGEMTLTSDTNGTMFTCDYKVTEKNTIELTADDQNMMMVSNLIGTTELKVTYDKEADALTFSPGIGGVATWEAVDSEQAKTVIDGLNEPVYEDITSGAPAVDEIPEEGTVE